MIVDTDFLDHWKTGMVIDELQDKCAPIYILRLWAHCQERKSDCFSMPSRGLKAQCKYEGDHEKFEAALVAAGFIERDGETIKVIGWAEKNASLIAAWENGGRGGRPKKKPTDNPQETHGLAMGNPAVTHGQPMENPTLTQTKPIRVDKSREDKKATYVAAPDGVSDSVWHGFKQIRKAKKAPVTDLVIHQIKKEADIAGITLDEALTECVTRGWQSFKADWYKPSAKQASGAFAGAI